MVDTHLALSASSFLLALYYYLKKPSRYANLPLPPSRKGLPLIGDLLQMPTEFEWKTYHEWCKELGTDIMHINVAGTHFIVLDSYEAVLELMERRSSTYSDRARMPMINELMKWSFNIAFMPYGEEWRTHRRLLHHNFHPIAALRFRPQELRATHNLLQRFLDNPEDVMGNLRYMAGETILSTTYGLDIQPKDDPYIQTSECAVHALAVAAIPGTFLVDIFPLLKYVPGWVPGAGFKKKAEEWSKLALRMLNLAFDASKERIITGNAPVSFTSASLQSSEERSHDEAYQERVIRNAAGTLYAAGTDTTLSAISSCILAILENPEILKKAQTELDSVIKPGHLPDFDDEESLPYITAMVLETLRWRDVVPIAVPRYLQVEDEYKGYRLPKGSIVIPNAYAILHDEKTYSDPFMFKPERFLTKDGRIDKSVPDPRQACFGFGRRICPGRYMAFSTIWIAIASLTYCFDIKKAVDENGKVIEPTHEYVSALVIHPKPFKASIVPRSPEHARAIRSAIIEHEFATT